MIKNGIYQFPPISTNKPATLPRRAKYVGMKKGRHTFEVKEICVNGEWMLLEDAAEILQERGARKRTISGKIKYSTTPAGVLLITEPAKVPAKPVKKKPKRRRPLTGEQVIALLLAEGTITANQVVEVLGR